VRQQRALADAGALERHQAVLRVAGLRHRVFASATPNRRSVAAIASATMIAIPAPAASQRRRDTALAHRVHARLARSSVCRCGQSRRPPSFAITTGNSVIATSVETSGISAPPYPRRNGSGIAMSASRPIPTVIPLKITARPAVSIAR
jgi:hypothetical protein